MTTPRTRVCDAGEGSQVASGTPRTGRQVPVVGPGAFPHDEHTALLMKCLWTLIWFAIVSVGTNSFGSWGTWSGFSVVGPLLTLAGVVGIVAVWITPEKHRLALEHVSFVAAVATVLIANGPLLATGRFFNTDAAAFSQRATQLFVHGINPYSVSFNPRFLLLHHARDFWTYTLGGGFVDKVSYPAGSFLLQAPFQILGIQHLATDWIDLFSWIAAALILYVVSPWFIKWLSPLFLLASSFTYMFTFGGTDALFIPFLMLAAWHWDDFVEPQATKWAKWSGPVSLGVACSIKQTPWFTVPFFILGVALEAHSRGFPLRRYVVRYTSLVAAAFAALNLPFVIWSPGAWFHGVLLPVTQPLVPDGQGLVSLVTHGFFHVVHPLDLQIASLSILMTLLLALYYWYPVLKSSWMFAIPLILFLPSRSLSNYLVDFVPAAFVMVLTTTARPNVGATPSTAWLRRLSITVPLLTSLFAIVVAFSSPPVGIEIVHYGSSRGNSYMNDVTLRLTNYTDTTISPHVMVIVGSGHPVGFWTPLAGNGALRIAAHGSVTTTMRPPRYMRAPGYGESWLLEVVTKSPAALTTTPAYTWPYGRKNL